MRINFKYLILLIVIVLVIAGIYFISRSSKKAEQVQTIPTPPLESPLRGKTLPSDKEAIKQRLVAPLGEAGTLSDDPNFRIDYIAPDIFQVEIKTTNIVDARENAIAWFKDKGFSGDDICNLPVTFYLSGEVAKQYEGSGLVFDSLPEFCQ